MFTIRHSTDQMDEVAPARAPWLAAHAPAEDQALGIELELIELVQQRDHVWPGAERDAIEAQIVAATERLARLAAPADLQLHEVA
jgi:hypothetical protein